MTIKQLRVGLDMTQLDMAKFLGISIVTYQHKEKGKKDWWFNEVKRMCNLAHISLDDIEA